MARPIPYNGQTETRASKSFNQPLDAPVTITTFESISGLSVTGSLALNIFVRIR